MVNERLFQATVATKQLPAYPSAGMTNKLSLVAAFLCSSQKTRFPVLRSQSFVVLFWLLGSLACGAANQFGSTVPRVATASDNWKFSRTEGRKEGEAFNAITKVADTTKSDLDFAGLIVRCAPRGKIEVLVALVQPFPPRSHPQVDITYGSTSKSFEGSMLAAGAAVLLPEEAAFLAGGAWQSLPSVSVSVKEDQNEIKGVVLLTGLRDALYRLTASCAE